MRMDMAVVCCKGYDGKSPTYPPAPVCDHAAGCESRRQQVDLRLDVRSAAKAGLRADLVAAGATENALARYDAGRLPDDERDPLLRTVWFADFAAFPRRVPLTAASIDHEDEEKVAECSTVGWSTSDAETEPLTAAQWDRLVAVNSAAAAVPGAAAVTIRERGQCACGGEIAALAIRVRIKRYGVTLDRMFAIE